MEVLFQNSRNKTILFRYWLGRSWNIMFRWTAKSYIFPWDYIFPEVRSTEGKYYPEWKYNSWHHRHVRISSVPVDICYIRFNSIQFNKGFIQFMYRSEWLNRCLDGQNWWFHQNLWCSITITKFGNKTRSLRTKQTEPKLDRFARILLWRSIVNHCVLCLRNAFLSGSVF